MADVQPVGERERKTALRQVLNYFEQNRGQMHRIVETEVDVSLEKDGYILAGKVDLLLGRDGRLELLDFKTGPRPSNAPELLAAYERQLCTYAHILEGRYGKRVDRMLLYWTSEATREDALMTLPYRPESLEEAGRHFDRTVRRIQAAEFRVSKPPEGQVCRQCDLRRLCRADGLLPYKPVYNAGNPPNRRPVRSTAVGLSRRRKPAVAKIDITRTELVWPGKYNDDGTLRETPRVQLPLPGHRDGQREPRPRGRLRASAPSRACSTSTRARRATRSRMAGGTS